MTRESTEHVQRTCLAGNGRYLFGIPWDRSIPLTGCGWMDEDIRAAPESGMNAHAAKPIAMGVPEQTIRSVPGTGTGPLRAVPPAGRGGEWRREYA